MIPPSLLNQIKEGNVVLFLGAGAMFGAHSPNRSEMPSAQELANLIADKFLDSSYLNKPLQYVSELAISEYNLFTVQKYIYDLISDFVPADFHIKLSEFYWRSIYTTNYDLIIEDAYRKAKSPLQLINPIIKNCPIEEIYPYENSLPYFKLHGSLNEINNPDLPLILTPDQYLTHAGGRDRLFSKFLEDSRTHTILFVGYSLADLDIRAIINQLEVLKDGRPRSFIIGPGITDPEARLWEQKKITSIISPFKAFIEELDVVFTPTQRALTRIRPVFQHAFFSKAVVSPNDIKPSEKLETFMKYDADFVHLGLPSKDSDPKEFYKGYMNGWDPIIHNYDFKRTDQDEILAEVFLDEYYAGNNNQFLFLLEGNAGSGKSVFLKRLAWEAGVTFDKICFFVKSSSAIRYDIISEIYDYVKTRIFLFLDGVKEREFEIITLLERAKKDKIPITIFAGERTNIWNTDCKNVSNYLTRSFSIRFIDQKECEDLLNLLEKYDSLNYLENKTKAERIAALTHRPPGTELLVALYEATHGKPFEEIILDEYEKINNDRARSLYLTISIFHRLGTYARAGLISRIHDIDFDEFKQKLFNPLKFIVFDQMNYRINDYIYLTRHKLIANIIFERVLSSQQSRFDEYVRLLSHLDIDFDSDRIVFLALVNAKNFNDSFNNQVLVRNLYDIAEKRTPDNARLFQQRAIYELNASSSNLNLADQYIKKAVDISKGEDSIILHTQAEIEYKKAEASTVTHEIEKHLKRAIDICNGIIKKYSQNPYPYHTILKSLILKLKLTLAGADVPSIERQIKEIEKELNTAKQLFSNQEFILEAEAKFNETIDNTPVALDLLERAFSINKSSPYLATRLASFYYKKNNDVEKAIKTIEIALENLNGDRELNFSMAYYLSLKDNIDLNLIILHLRRSFTRGDHRYKAQFWYARYLFLNGDFEPSKIIFSDLSKVNIDPDIKYGPTDIIKEDGKPVLFKGIIKKKEASYGFVKREILGDDIFFYRFQDNLDWTKLKIGDKIQFNLGFNYTGPVAINIKLVK